MSLKNINVLSLSGDGEKYHAVSLRTIADILNTKGAEYIPGLFGAEGEGGFLTQADAIPTVPGSGVTVDGQSLSDIWTELLAMTAAFNSTRNFLVSLFSFETEMESERVGVYQTPSFEEATEFGRPQKSRLQYVRRGFPLDHYDLAYGYTQEYLDEATGEQIFAIQAQSESAWWSLQMETVMGALFDDTNATYENTTVRRLFNNDGEVPPVYKRWTHDGTHQHYLTSGGATFTSANLDTMEEHLVHHGYSEGRNGEVLVLLANRADVATIRGFTPFVPAETASVPAIIAGPVRGEERGAPGSLRVEGYHGKWVIVEENDIPAGYLLGMATGGPNALQNPVGLRVHRNPSARGLRLVEGPNGRYPLIDAVYDGYTGAGVRHRGGAVIMQETAGAYAVPTFG